MTVTCEYCNACFHKSSVINSRHKAVCEGWKQRAQTLPSCLCGYPSTSQRHMKEHRLSCDMWQTRNRGEVQQARVAHTLQAKYGESVTTPLQIPGVKERLRQTMFARYGVEYCQQSEVIRAKVRATNLQKYGVECNLQDPTSLKRVRKLNVERYDGPAPMCSPEIREKVKQTNLKRWGVEWTTQNVEVRKKQQDTHFSRYGGHYMSTPEGKEAAKEGMILRYGVDHSTKIKGYREQVEATCLQKYGVHHFLASPEVKEKRRLTWQFRYGVDHPLQNPEIYSRLVQTVRERYGVDCVFQNAVIKKTCFEKSLETRRLPGPNNFERSFWDSHPDLVYTGDGTYWRRLPLLGKHKNPDFIVPGLNLRAPLEGAFKVIELFGDYWHSEKFTGKNPTEHAAETVAAYQEIGLECLIVWESELKANPSAQVERVMVFRAA